MTSEAIICRSSNASKYVPGLGKCGIRTTIAIALIVSLVGLAATATAQSRDNAEDICRAFEFSVAQINSQCDFTCDLETKNRLFNNFFALQRRLDVLTVNLGIGLDCTTNISGFCGGIFEGGSIRFTPGDVSLDIGEEKEIESRIFASSEEPTGHCSPPFSFQLCTTDADCLFPSIACEIPESPLCGTLQWISGDPEVATVAPNVTQADVDEVHTVVVTGVARGNTSLTAVVKEFPEISSTVPVTVGGTIADVVFVIETSEDMDLWIGVEVFFNTPGLNDHGDDIVQGLRDQFDLRSRIAIVTYNRPLVHPYNILEESPSICSGEPSGEGFNAPAAAFTDHMEFRFLVDIPSPIRGFESLAVICGLARWGDYRGAFVYSALMHAMQGSENLGFWREDLNGQNVPKIIVLIAWSRPGGFLNPLMSGGPYFNDPEPFTGFTRETVIQEAQQRDVEIHIFNVNPFATDLEGRPGIREGSREVFTRIAQETGGTYQETEFSGSYPDEQLYQGIIDTMDQMGN